MNKIIPIKLERKFDTNISVIEWKLGNTCNYNCDFCSLVNKDGSMKWMNIDAYINIAKKFINQAPNRKIRFQFTGGEVTLYRDLDKLLQFIVESGHITAVISNGSRTIRWWKELAEKNIIDFLALSCHVHQGGSPEHIKKIIQLFENTKTTVTVLTSAPAKYFEEAYAAYMQITDVQCFSIFHAVNVNGGLDNYTDEQMKIFQQNAGKSIKNFRIKQPEKYDRKNMILTYDDGTTKEFLPMDIHVTPEISTFTNWNCTIGQKSLIISYDKINRGICGVGGQQDVLDNSGFFNDTVVCSKNSCDCNTDISQPKFKN
jgi:organic radical activating enzyme